MNLQSLAMLAVAAALVIAGVVIEGTQQNPWNLAMSYLLPVGAIEVLRRRQTVWAWAMCTVIVGCAIYGAAWTLGPEHATSAWAALVYIGLVGAVVPSLMVSLRNKYGQGKRGA